MRTARYLNGKTNNPQTGLVYVTNQGDSTVPVVGP